MQHQNDIMVNQVGFLPVSGKTVIYSGAEKTFSVNRLQDDEFVTVFEGIFEDSGTELATAKRGDFSALKKQGIYRIKVGNQHSRCFIISEDAYGTVERMLSYFFTWQRCDSVLGWNGQCHNDDSLILKSGEVRYLNKGHHQSGDLRKWAWGTSIGMIGYAEYALEFKPGWDQGIIAEELSHSCDYFLALIHPQGFIIDGTFVPEEFPPERTHLGCGDYNMMWRKRLYFESPAPEPAHWYTLRFLSLASRYFASQDPVYARRCLEGARQVWNYMEKNPMMGDYDLPRYPPHGHERMKEWYTGFYPSSSLHHGARACAAAELFSAEPSESYKVAAIESLNILASLRLNDNGESDPASGCFYEGPDTQKISNEYIYFYSTNIPPAFTAALKRWPEAVEASMWRECVSAIGDQFLFLGNRNPFHRVPTCCTDESGDIGTPAKKDPLKETFCGQTRNGEFISTRYFSYIFNLDIIAFGRFLLDASKLFGRTEYAMLASNQLDWILGVNPWDASNVEGVGYNHPHRGIFGEFFPPIPQIPGAVYTGISNDSFESQKYGFSCEYDMPIVGQLMAFLGDMKLQDNRIGATRGRLK
jgi:hypothetical protein